MPSGGYDNRRCVKSPTRLTVEEFEVQQAMIRGGYEHDPYRTTAFVPTAVLFQVYRRYIGTLRFRGDDQDTPVDLGLRQFGAALNRVWDEPQRARRSWHGTRRWGYLGVVGPESLVTRDEVGRPPWDVDLEDDNGRR